MNAMVRRQWLNMGLLGLASGLIALIVFEPGQQKIAEITPLLARKPAQLERVVLERAGQEQLTFERRTEGWWMTAPEPGMANAVLINAILDLATLPCPLRYAANQINLKQVQLDPPQLTLWLDSAEIRFGATTPIDGQRYLQIDNTVHLCPDHIYALLTSAVRSFLAPPVVVVPPIKSGR